MHISIFDDNKHTRVEVLIIRSQIGTLHTAVEGVCGRIFGCLLGCGVRNRILDTAQLAHLAGAHHVEGIDEKGGRGHRQNEAAEVVSRPNGKTRHQLNQLTR